MRCVWCSDSQTSPGTLRELTTTFPQPITNFVIGCGNVVVKCYEKLFNSFSSQPSVKCVTEECVLLSILLNKSSSCTGCMSSYPLTGVKYVYLYFNFNDSFVLLNNKKVQSPYIAANFFILMRTFWLHSWYSKTLFFSRNNPSIGAYCA